jgi:DNA-binding transcriptional ArsR family regulator
MSLPGQSNPVWSFRSFQLAVLTLEDSLMIIELLWLRLLLETIAGEEECPCQRLRREFPVSKGTISHHIKELVRAGLIEARREGQYLHCEIRRDVLQAYTVELLRRVKGAR